MLRAGLLWLSEQPRIFQFVRKNGLARRFASRFVAGETPETAIAACRRLAADGSGLTASLNVLGESVSGASEAEGARDQYLRTLAAIHAAGVPAHVSIKLTQLGLDLDERQCVANATAVLAEARRIGTFIRIDMEASAYAERTLRLFREHFHPAFGDTVGVVIQTYLRRSARDVEDLIAMKARVRLVKGAYKEPATVAFQDKADVDAQFERQMKRLLEAGNYAAIATHDERLIGVAKAYAAERGIAANRFEFQMLYGVRRDLQLRLKREGFNVRVYIPFGTQWYPYLMRRLAERPANVAFILGSIMKESVGRKS
jgi:proline dehydrogenase